MIMDLEESVYPPIHRDRYIFFAIYSKHRSSERPFIIASRLFQYNIIFIIGLRLYIFFVHAASTREATIYICGCVPASRALDISAACQSNSLVCKFDQLSRSVLGRKH